MRGECNGELPQVGKGVIYKDNVFNSDANAEVNLAGKWFFSIELRNLLKIADAGTKRDDGFVRKFHSKVGING